MPEEDLPESAAPPARPLNRRALGTISIVQTLLLFVTVVAVNYLAAHHYSRKDLSRSADYTLSPATRSYLLGPELANRTKPVKWIMAFRRVSPFYERVRALAEEYERVSQKRIDLKTVDPLRSPDRMQEIMATYGLTLARDIIIIDARDDDAPAATGSNNKRTLNPHVKIVVADEMGVYTTADGVRKLSGFQGEDLLTARLVESIEGQPRKMALIADKSRIAGSEDNPQRKSLEAILRYQNVALQELNLAGLKDIPDDVAGLVLAAPRYDFTDAEIAVLERYWNKERAAILVLLDAGEIPPKLRAFLRGNGITARNDRIVAREKKRLVTTVRGVFTQGVTFTRDLAGQTTEFDGASSSLDVREGAADLLNRRIYPMGLVKVLDGFWGETKFGQGGEQFDESEDNKPPLHIAACVTRGAESDDRFAAGTSRMVVVSNTDFLNPLHARAENQDFLASCANWLVGRESLAGIGPRSFGTYKLPLLEAQVSFINRINLFFLPAFLLLVGGFVWSSRRA